MFICPSVTLKIDNFFKNPIINIDSIFGICWVMLMHWFLSLCCAPFYKRDIRFKRDCLYGSVYYARKRKGNATLQIRCGLGCCISIVTE